MTKYELHIQRWGKGCGASICCEANRIVLARGKIPCDILFIGEAPGVSEDVLGLPFIGPAGKLLDQIITRSVPSSLRVALTNLVGCIPKEGGTKTGEPDDESILSCKPRLEEFIGIANPRLIVAVGNLSRTFLERGMRDSVRIPREVKVAGIVHPAFILRQNVANQGLQIQRCVVTIANAVEELL